MNREIKFRVWMIPYDDLPPRMYFVEYLDKYLFDRVPVMQYTGLKDKNGKEIYEGDIVKQYGEQEFYPVIYDSELAVFVLKISDNIIADFLPEREVIGNIYENPELLSH